MLLATTTVAALAGPDRERERAVSQLIDCRVLDGLRVRCGSIRPSPMATRPATMAWRSGKVSKK